MERRSKRMKSLLIRPSHLDQLVEPIKKVIKPNQIYNDYKIPSGNVNEEISGLILSSKKQKDRYASLGARTLSCECECHRLKSEADHVFTKTHSKRALLTPSPEKSNAKNAVSRKSSGNSVIFPYKSFDYVPGHILPSLSRYRVPQKISNIRSYFKY